SSMPDVLMQSDESKHDFATTYEHAERPMFTNIQVCLVATRGHFSRLRFKSIKSVTGFSGSSIGPDAQSILLLSPVTCLRWHRFVEAFLRTWSSNSSCAFSLLKN